MAPSRTGGRRRVLPASSRELIKLCEDAGWTTRRSNGGTFVTSPSGTGALIPDGVPHGRSLSNLHAQLRRAGLDADLTAKEALNEERRRAALDAPAPRARFVAPSADPGAPETPDPKAPETAMTAVTRKTTQPLATEMYTETVLVTPKMAREWLDREPPLLSSGKPVTQRPRRAVHTLWLAEQMDAGQFCLTPQGVSLAPTVGNTGGVLDGQHRLAAIEVCGRPVLMRVTYNVPPETFTVLDTGKARSAADVLAIIGETNTFHLSTVAKLLAVWEMWRVDPTGPLRDWMNWNRVKVTNADTVDLVRRWPTLGDHVRQASTFIGPPVRINIAAATVFRLWTVEVWPGCGESVDGAPSLLDAWFDKLREGVGPEFLDARHPIVRLRNWLLAGGPKRSTGASREATLVGLLKCWNNTNTGKPMDLLRIGSNDLMPTPYKP